MQVSRLALPALSTSPVSLPAVRNLSTRLHKEDLTQTDKDKPLKSWKKIPGPSSLPFVGPILHFIPRIGAFSSFGPKLSHHLYSSFGPLVRLDGMMGQPALLFLFDAEASAQILRSENAYPLRPGFQSLEYYRKILNSTNYKNTTGLLTDQGEKWKTLRSVANPIMLQPKTIKLYSSALDQIALDMIKRMKSLRNEDNMIPGNFGTEINRWSLESIGSIALGGRIGCLEPDLADDSPAKQLIQCVHDIFDKAPNLDFKPSLWRYYPTREFKILMNLYEKHVNLSKYFIKRAIIDIEKRKHLESGEVKGILEKLLEIDEDFALIMATDMLFAGVDTAAYTILATLYLLATNPEKQVKLRQEVLSKVESRQYMKACIKESMRMYPVVSSNMRCTTKEYEVLGYKIPKGMRIVFVHQHLSMMEEHFLLPEEFIPERWLTTKDDPLYYGNAHPFAMLPFGFGVRQCIGKRIAALEVETFLGKLVESFSIEWKGGPLNVRSSSINYIDGPYNYIFKDL